MKIYKVKSFAKINLVLHVTGKLKKLHKIESIIKFIQLHDLINICLLYTSPSPRDRTRSRMPSSA